MFFLILFGPIGFLLFIMWCRYRLAAYRNNRNQFLKKHIRFYIFALRYLSIATAITGVCLIKGYQIEIDNGQGNACIIIGVILFITSFFYKRLLTFAFGTQFKKQDGDFINYSLYPDSTNSDNVRFNHIAVRLVLWSALVFILMAITLNYDSQHGFAYNTSEVALLAAIIFALFILGLKSKDIAKYLNDNSKRK